MKDWLLPLLRIPLSDTPLTLSSDGKHLVGDGISFHIDGDIPSFLERHTAENGFDYTAHYTADAEVFDYFEEESDPLSALGSRLLRHTTMRQVPDSARLLLDVGCGSAFVAQHFCPRGRRVVSMDIAQANVRKALQLYPSDNHAAVVADAYRLPFADNTFDCIIASEIIEHTVDPQGFLAALIAKVKPGGLLLVSTPYRERIAYSLCIHCNCKTPHNAHLHSFDEAKFERLAAPLPADITGMRLVDNKLILRSHLAVPLSRLGMPLWSACDRLANRLTRKASHFIIALRKKTP